MTLLIGFLTFMLVVTCLLLVLLILVQLPKKEAGAGLAFGAGAVDTLIGAGSGNALTQLTKYSAGIFMALALVLAILNANRHQSASRLLQQELSKKSSPAAMLPTQPSGTPASAAALTNNLLPTNMLPQELSTTTSGLQVIQTPPVSAPANNSTPVQTPPPVNNPPETKTP